MYSRDPLVIYREKLEQDVTTSNDHYENIQSTNWNSVRFKLPPPGSDIGWRIEFRTPELQLTDFENAAFSIFTVLLSRVIIAFSHPHHGFAGILHQFAELKSSVC